MTLSLNINQFRPETMEYVAFNHLFPLGVNCSSSNDSFIKATLDLGDLWEQFESLTTEMIITKPGRRMFPTLKFNLSGLDPEREYALMLDMSPASEHRYKYQNFQWVIAGKAESSPSSRMYCHPDSPAPGSYWMEQPVNFYKLKLTNNFMDRTAGHIVLNSMHKYLPCLHIMVASTSNDKSTGINQQRTWLHATTISFKQAAFIAVTAYQNEDITRLKILNNPFAKGFREGEQTRRDKKTAKTFKRSFNSPRDSDTDSQKQTKILKVEEKEESGVNEVKNENDVKSDEKSSEKTCSGAISKPSAVHFKYNCVCAECMRSRLPFSFPTLSSDFNRHYYPPYYQPVPLPYSSRPLIYYPTLDMTPFTCYPYANYYATSRFVQ